MSNKNSKKLTQKEKEIVDGLSTETVDKIMTPMNDFVFKKLFGSVGKEKLVKDFLEAILGIEIESVELGLETILTAEAIDEKTGIIDVRVKLKDGTDIDLEVQNAENSFIVKRSHFYASRMYSKQLSSGIDYGKLKKVIVIFITNFEVFSELKEYHTKWLMTEHKNKEEYLDEIELHFIEMPKFLNSERGEKNKIDEWLLFLKFPNEEMMKEIMEKNENIKEAKEELDKIKQDEHMQYLAWLREKQVLDSNSMRSDGLRIGREQGRAEGLAEGREKTKSETAKKMLKKGMDIDLIAEISELTKEEIEKIQLELKNEESNEN